MTTSPPHNASMSKRSEGLPKVPKEAVKKTTHALLDALEDITFGSIAGICGKYIEYPFDTVKVRLQSQPDNLPLRYKGPIDCFQQSIRQDGVYGGLYRGISAPLLGAALEASSLFVWEQAAQKVIRAGGNFSSSETLPLPALFLSGAISGAITSLVLTPIELVKCKIQVPKFSSSGAMTVELHTPISVVKEIYIHQGVKGFWHGQIGTLIRETGGCAAWFGTKETMTKLFHNYNGDAVRTPVNPHHPGHPLSQELPTLPYWQQAVAGASAGVSYNFLFFPADTIKSRMQTTAINDTTLKRTFMKEGAMLWKEHGVRGMYRGCGITCLRSAPSSAFIFMIYDSLKANFHFTA